MTVNTYLLSPAHTAGFFSSVTWRLLNVRLLDFQTAHSAFGEFILLKVSFVDTLSGISGFKCEIYPDQQVMIRLSEAKELIAELQKQVQYIEAEIEDSGTSTTFLD
ncbi:hypothetical protein [Ewingella americana]